MIQISKFDVVQTKSFQLQLEEIICEEVNKELFKISFYYHLLYCGFLTQK